MGPEPTQHFDADWIIGHPLPEILVMLLGQDRGWNQYGDLFPTHYRLECGADCYFGFAETDIATNKAIHGADRFHVRF